MKVYLGLVSISLIFLGAAASGCDDGDNYERTCAGLEEYYDDCCATCGSQDSYCSFDTSNDTESECADELDFWEGECVCD